MKERGERGEGNSTAIVAIVVLVLIAVGMFFFFGGARLGGPPGQVNIQIEKKGDGQPAAKP